MPNRPSASSGWRHFTFTNFRPNSRLNIQTQPPQLTHWTTFISVTHHTVFANHVCGKEPSQPKESTLAKGLLLIWRGGRDGAPQRLPVETAKRFAPRTRPRSASLGACTGWRRFVAGRTPHPTPHSRVASHWKVVRLPHSVQLSAAPAPRVTPIVLRAASGVSHSVLHAVSQSHSVCTSGSGSLVTQ